LHLLILITGGKTGELEKMDLSRTQETEKFLIFLEELTEKTKRLFNGNHMEERTKNGQSFIGQQKSQQISPNWTINQLKKCNELCKSIKN